MVPHVSTAMLNLLKASNAVDKIRNETYEFIDLGYGGPLPRSEYLAFAIEWRDIAQEQHTYFASRTIRRGFLPKRPPRIL